MATKKWKPTRRGDLVTRMVSGQDIWYFDDYVQTDRFATPRRIRKSTMCLKADYERAKEVRDQIVQRIKAGDEALRRPPTFDEWVVTWRATYEQETPLDPGTVTCHNQAVGPLSEFLGTKRMDQITDGDCIAFKQWRQQRPRMDNKGRPIPGTTTSPNTVLTNCRIASSIWRCALRARVVQTNPWANIKLGTMGSRTRVLTEEEQARVLGAASPELVRFIVVTLGTSFRLGVLLELPLRPITHVTTRQQQVIPVIRMLSKGKEHLQPLLPVVQQAIADQTKFIEQERPYASLLFPYGETTIRSWLRKLAFSVGIPPFSPHDIRRTFGTRAHEALTLDETATLLNNTAAVAAKHYVKPSEGLAVAQKLRTLSMMAPALLLPSVDTSVVTDEDKAL
jgi:integrase